MTEPPHPGQPAVPGPGPSFEPPHRVSGSPGTNYPYGHPQFDPQAGQPPASPPPEPPTPDPRPWGYGPTEELGRGLLFALGAIPVAAAAAALLAAIGFYASISSFILAALAVKLYTKGSGGRISKGVPAIIAVIVVGVIVSYFTSNAVELALVFNRHGGYSELGYDTVGSFVLDNVLHPDALSGWQKELFFFLLFAVLGTFGTLRRLIGHRRASR